MDDLGFLRARIESYADYTNDGQRLLSDEQIRAYVGVALSGLFERLEPSGAPAEALAAVLLRCQFADQRVVRALEAHDVGASEIAAVHVADRELVALADRANAVDLAGLGAYVVQVDAALNRRSEILLNGAGGAL